MSNSFPNSWEPYGSSQSGMNWRLPATKPAKQDLSDRWKNAQAKVLQTPFTRPSPTLPAQRLCAQPAKPAPPPKTKLDLASFQRADAEHRLIARYESVRSEVREVATAVKILSDAVEGAREKDDARNKGILDEIRTLQDGLTVLRERVQTLGKGDNEAVRECVKRVVEEVVHGLTVDVQAVSEKVDGVGEWCEKICESVDAMKGEQCENVGKFVVEGVDKLINRGVAKVEEGAKKLFDENIEIYGMVLEHVEEIVKPLYDGVLYERGDDDEVNAIFSVARTRSHSNKAGRRGADGNGLRVDDGDTHAKFDVAREACLNSDRWTATNGDQVPSRPPTRGSTDNGSDRRVWAKVRIRPGKKMEVVDLTGESIGEQDLFEDDLGGLGRGVKTENDLVDDRKNVGKRKISGRREHQSGCITRSAKRRGLQ